MRTSKTIFNTAVLHKSICRRLISTKANKKVVLDFLNISTFEDNEIQKSFHKYALNSCEDSKTSLTTLKISEDIFRHNIRKHLDKSVDPALTEDDVLSIFKNLPPHDGHHPPSLQPTILENKTSVSSSPATNAESLSSHSSSVQSTTNSPNSKQLSRMIDYTHYRQQLRAFGEKIDERVWAVSASFILTGASIGIVIPCMPLLVKQLELSPSSFGMIITAYGLAKLLGNIPAGYYVDLYGRKPTMVAGLGLCAVGIGGVSTVMLPYVDPVPTIMACRFITGVGVSCFSSGAIMMTSDVSTPLNRTRTTSPVMASFQAGVAMGPAIGGLSIHHIGIPYTYVTCGAIFAMITALNQMFLKETMPSTPRHSIASSSSSSSSTPWPTHEVTHLKEAKLKNSPHTTLNNTHTNSNILTPSDCNKAVDNHGSSSSSSSSSSSNNSSSVHHTNRGLIHAFRQVFHDWRELSHDRRLTNICILNAFYWSTIAGVQMTVLPMYMVSSAFELGPGQIGLSFAMMSVWAAVTSQPIAYIADKLGKIPSVMVGGALVASSFVLLPYATTYEELLVVLTPLAIGSTVLQSVPTAYITDLIPISRRSQAQSLFRTAGDIGLLLGAAAAGVLIDYGSFHTTIEVNAAIMMFAMCLFGIRHHMHMKKTIPHTNTPKHTTSAPKNSP